MSAHTVPSTVLATWYTNGCKEAIILLTCSASYDAAGSTINLSTSGNLGVVHGFTTVLGVSLLGTTIGTDANSKYYPVFVPAASHAAATGKLKIHDTSAAADAEVTAATNLSAVTMTIKIVGT